MLFDEDSIRNFDPDVLSESDKKYLLEKFFSKGKNPAWKYDLKEQWAAAKKKQAAQRRWNSYLLNEFSMPLRNPFRISHSELVRRAKRHKPQVVGQAVTDFTKWLYSLYQGAPSIYVLNEGKDIEKQISSCVGPVPGNDAWELVFQDPLTERATPKQISALTVGGKPLFGVPDVVFREKATGRILIIERKASNSDVPDDGWPNLRAQLWAYGHIDEWKETPNILLIGEVWSHSPYGIHISRILRWELHHRNFYSENEELFSIYAGHSQ